MAQLQIQQRALQNVGALSHLVEAATAMSELLEGRTQQPPSSQSSCESPSTTTPALICDDDDRGNSKSSTSGQSKNSKKKDIFPQKLLEILDDSALTDIVSWLPHGRSFVILRPDLFCEQVLPRYLPPIDSRASTKYPSFTRKLNRWGFRQATRGADTGAFHHPYFRRDQPELCTRMVCQKSRERQTPHRRSLPPKKRAFSQSSPPPPSVAPFEAEPVPTSNMAALMRTAAAATADNFQQAPSNVSSDDRSVGNSSTSSSSNEAMRRPSNVALQIQKPPMAAIISPTDVSASRSHHTSTRSSTPNSGAIALPWGISNDADFVASTLRQRDTLEVVRAAKSMLYEAYMKAVKEQGV